MEAKRREKLNGKLRRYCGDGNMFKRRRRRRRDGKKKKTSILNVLVKDFTERVKKQ